MGNLDRQKILMIFGAALVCAFLMSWFVYAKAVAPKTEKTVKVHRGRIMEKMRVRSVADLVRAADRLGIKPTPSPPRGRTQ